MAFLTANSWKFAQNSDSRKELILMECLCCIWAE